MTAVPAAAEQDKATRQWQLLGYAKQGRAWVQIHESVCTGDRALDEAMAVLERRDDCTRVVAKPL